MTCPASDNSRIQRVERYLQSNADAQAALTANGGIPSEDEYLNALAVLIDPASFTEEEVAAARLAFDAFEAAKAVVAAFEEADNRPYDELRRAVFDDIAAYLGLAP